MNKKRFTGILLGLALMLGLMTGLCLTAQAETWSSSFTTDGRTVDGGVTVSANIELTIPKGVTLTVNGGIDAGSHTLTVIGAGRLVVNGINGGNGFQGDLIVDGADVTVNGGDGGNGSNGRNGGNGGKGGSGVVGDVTVKSGSFTASGGSGGKGGDGYATPPSGGRSAGGKGFDGGDGGNGVTGYVTVEGGSAAVYGGSGGDGGDGGNGSDGNDVGNGFDGGTGGHGGDGGSGSDGDVTVKSGSFTANGGSGGNGGNGGNGGTPSTYSGGAGGYGGKGFDGGKGVSGNVTVEGGSVTVTGGSSGNSGNGGKGGNGGSYGDGGKGGMGGTSRYGGKGVGGNVTVNYGLAKLSGGNGGKGGTGGKGGKSGTGVLNEFDNGAQGENGASDAAVSGTIFGETSAKESDNDSDWAVISGGRSNKRYVRAEGPHRHSFTYAVGTGNEANTITATCTGADCPIGTGLMTISAPTALTYDGTGKAATLNAYDTTAFPDTYAISYTKDGADFSETPTDVGDYTASVTVGSGVRAATVSVSYTIAPITISSVAVDIDAPVATAALAATATTADHVTLGALSWQPADTNAGYATAYTATVTATAKPNYAFADGVTATVNGNDVTPAKNQDGTLGVSYTFPATKQNPLPAAPVDQAVDYSPDGIAIPVEGMFNIADGAGAATYAVTGGTGAGTWDAQAGRLAVLKCGTFTVSVSTAESTTHAAGAEISATLTVNRVAPTVTAPTPRGLTYSGQAQALVDAGFTDNGTLYYAVTENDKAPAENLYDMAIPTGADIGTYYVWYRVVGDANHTNTDPFPLAVTIYPVDREALKTAVARAGDYYDSIRDKAQYADIAAGLESAISAAGTVAGNDKATESDIAGAISGVIDALVKAVQDVAAVDKQIADEEAAKQRADEAARKQAADQAAADAVTKKINALPDEAGVNDREAVAAARAVFDALTDGQRALVPKAAQDRLAAAEAQVRAAEAARAAEGEKAAGEAAKQQAADQAAANAVTKTIRALPAEAGVNDKAAVAAARAAYDALTNDQKALVPYDALSRLAAAEAQVRAAEEAADAAAKQRQAADEAAKKQQAADQAAANAVTKTIRALPAEAGVNDKAAVAAARAAYDALTNDQKALVPYDALSRLAAAEAEVRAAEADAGKKQEEEPPKPQPGDETAKQRARDEAAASAVTQKINALPAEAGVNDKAAVAAARAAYDALTEAQKTLVPADALDRLAAAEAQVRAAEEAGQPIRFTNFTFTVKDRVYTGEAVKKPVVTVMYGRVKLKEGRDYTVEYNTKAKKIGAYRLKITGIGKYAGTKTLTFKIIPQGTAFTELTGGKRRITLKWEQQAHITGYQIEYGLKRDFAGARKLTVNRAKTLAATVRKLKSGQKYYVRIRTFAKVGGRRYWSAWSEPRAVKTGGEKGNAPGPDGEPEGLETGAGELLPGLDALDGGGMDMDEIEIVME